MKSPRKINNYSSTNLNNNKNNTEYVISYNTWCRNEVGLLYTNPKHHMILLKQHIHMQVNTLFYTIFSRMIQTKSHEMYLFFFRRCSVAPVRQLTKIWNRQWYSPPIFQDLQSSMYFYWLGVLPDDLTTVPKPEKWNSFWSYFIQNTMDSKHGLQGCVDSTRATISQLRLRTSIIGVDGIVITADSTQCGDCNIGPMHTSKINGSLNKFRKLIKSYLTTDSKKTE